MYNNLIYLLVVILILSTTSTPDAPQFPLALALAAFIVKAGAYLLLVRRSHANNSIRHSADYFSAEQKFSILAIAFLAVDIYLLDLKYFAAQIPFAKSLPVITDFCGLLIFFGYLCLMWAAERNSYETVFGGRPPGRFTFLLDNLKTNLSIILPWLILSLLSDLLKLAPIPALQHFLASTWGEPLIVLAFFLLLSVFFPALVVRLWNCKPLPAGETRTRIEEFCRSERLTYAEIMLWPMFEGRMLTAGIMGIVGRFRYLLITPSLLKAMEPDEINAVMAHEIGHAKRYHLQLYILLFLGFGILAQTSSYPILYLVLNSETFYSLLEHVSKSGRSSIMAFLASAPMFIIMIIYFRFIFGFFMRNFERQADLYAFETLGTGSTLIAVFEKISWLSGNIRDQPSWHHFSISQRVEFLEQCAAKPSRIKGHHRKVYSALSLFLLVLALGFYLQWKLPDNLIEGATRERLAESIVQQKIREEPNNPAWHHLMGDLQQGRKLYGEAVHAYKRALEIKPYQPEVQNNLAWLLLTADDPAIIDPVAALELAKSASTLMPHGFILDTLAEAYWANDFPQLAVKTEMYAANRDPANKAYYDKQIKKFSEQKWRPPGRQE